MLDVVGANGGARALVAREQRFLDDHCAAKPCPDCDAGTPHPENQLRTSPSSRMPARHKTSILRPPAQSLQIIGRVESAINYFSKWIVGKKRRGEYPKSCSASSLPNTMSCCILVAIDAVICR